MEAFSVPRVWQTCQGPKLTEALTSLPGLASTLRLVSRTGGHSCIIRPPFCVVFMRMVIQGSLLQRRELWEGFWPLSKLQPLLHDVYSVNCVEHL